MVIMLPEFEGAPSWSPEDMVKWRAPCGVHSLIIKRCENGLKWKLREVLLDLKRKTPQGSQVIDLSSCSERRKATP